MVSQTEISALNLTHLRLSFPKEGICHLQLDRQPVNALNLAAWDQLLQALTYIETTLFPKTIRVLIISSNASAPLFSAGNDITELHVPSTTKPRFTNFWLTSTAFLSRLYKSPLYTIAAIRGQTFAAGCIISLCCDYRIALAKSSLGLNEVSLGIPVPVFWARLFIHVVSIPARGEQALARGELLFSKEAQQLGLINQIVVVGGRDELLEEAVTIAEKWTGRTGTMARVETKMSIRKEFADRWNDYAPDEARSAWEQLSQKSSIATLGGFLERTKRMQKAKM